MDEFTAAEAAKWLDISREAVDLAAREGRLPVSGGDGPRRFSTEALEAYHQARVQEKVAGLARARETPVSVARRVRAALSATDMGMPVPLAVKLKAVPVDWRSLFTRAELAAACVRDGEGCRWCRAVEFADFRGLRPLEFSRALRELFGADPCGVCGPVLMAPFMAALAARVHRDGGRPPVARTGPVAAAGSTAAAVPSSQRSRPVQRAADDDGRSMVQRRLQQTRARLKDARRRGDTRYALALQKTLQSLVADARVVDGRARSAAGPAGEKRCGTPVGVRCSCHPNDGWVKRGRLNRAYPGG